MFTGLLYDYTAGSTTERFKTMVVEKDNHFVSVNYYAETSEHTNNDVTSISDFRLQIHHDDSSVTTNGTVVEKKISVSLMKHALQRFLVALGVFFIIGSYSIPVILYYIQDKVDLSAFTKIGNNSSVS